MIGLHKVGECNIERIGVSHWENIEFVCDAPSTHRLTGFHACSTFAVECTGIGAAGQERVDKGRKGRPSLFSGVCTICKRGSQGGYSNRVTSNITTVYLAYVGFLNSLYGTLFLCSQQLCIARFTHSLPELHACTACLAQVVRF
jgi:hypothetical protein